MPIFIHNPLNLAEKKPQIPPLRYATVGMTILFGRWNAGLQTDLSSRPERSVVEGPAVSSHPTRRLLIKVTALPFVIPTRISCTRLHPSLRVRLSARKAA